MFTKSEVESVYNRFYESIFKKLDDESERTFGQRYTLIHKWRTIHDVLLLPPMKSGQQILEIGPSMTSCILRELSGASVTTLCIDELNRNFLDPFGIPLCVCDINREKPALSEKSFDLILFCEVFEHFLYAPESALITIVSLCRPGGHIFFSVPNFACIQKRIQLLCGKNPQDRLSDKIAYYAHIREPVYGETKRWWAETGVSFLSEGFTNYDEFQPGGLFSKMFWTARFLKIRNWYGLFQIWFPKTRQYFYFLLKTPITT
jgi:SAM-dependent methyltransferase